MTRALITGVQGQTGYYLAERLVADGWDVHGTASIPRSTEAQTGVELHEVDLGVGGQLSAMLNTLKPSLIVNLAAISSVAQSWRTPVATLRVNTDTVAEIAEFLSERNDSHTRVVQASSSEIFGDADSTMCTEETPLRPINPYGVSKAASHLLGQTYRRSGLNWSNAILYNHESPRRPETFLSRKVSSAVARISLGLQEAVELGDLTAARDWGWAPDYAEALALISTIETPDDFVIATGVAHSVRDFVSESFAAVGISDWQAHVRINPEFIRPTEVKVSLGDSSKLRNRTGWQPKVAFSEMVTEMVRADLDRANQSEDGT